jgi:hypothetical protein
MSDESPLRSGRQRDSGHGAGGSAGEPISLQGRAAFLKNWDWQPVAFPGARPEGPTKDSAEGGRAQHGANSETRAACEKEWRQVLICRRCPGK